ncbi:MAG: serine/threonine-protein kinase, partial [Polyangiaceae bacterium]
MEGADTESAPGLVGGRYELEVLLGRGGAGEVWRARHVTLNSHVAIKFLHGATDQLESTRRRFLKEAQVTAQLKTRYAVQVFDYGFTDTGRPYLVMELLDGETVSRRLELLGRLPPAVAAAFLGQVARALERAHAIGIVHRDLKPDNLVVVVDEEGRECIKVLDFGIAKLLGDLDTGAADDEDPTLLQSRALNTFTRTGAFLGTPFYMAPEQIKNSRDVDLRADVWAFGVVAFQCLTGKPPFQGKNLLELFGHIERGEHLAAGALCPDLPRSFDLWFDIACAVDRERRFSSARSAATRLALAIDPEASTTQDSVTHSDALPTMQPASRDVVQAPGVLSSPPPTPGSPPPVAPDAEPRSAPRMLTAGAWAAVALSVLVGVTWVAVRHGAAGASGGGVEGIPDPGSAAGISHAVVATPAIAPAPLPPASSASSLPASPTAPASPTLEASAAQAVQTVQT